METTASTRTLSGRLDAGDRGSARDRAAAEGDAARSAALEVAEIVRTLDADDDVVIAAMLQPLLDGKFIDENAAARLLWR